MNKLQSHIHNLLWSLWTEMGVPGVARAHTHCSIDPEPLIVWTPFLASHDPRLLGLAFDWCVANASHIERIRFPKLVDDLLPDAREDFAKFSGALHHHGISWKPRTRTVTRKSIHREKLAIPMERPSLVRFRVRAFSGYKVRSEVIALLLSGPRVPQTAAELTPSGFSRRSVERVIAELLSARLLIAHGAGRGRRFRLRDALNLQTLMNCQDLQWPRWDQLFRLCALLVQCAHLPPQSANSRVAVAQQHDVLEALAHDLLLEPPPPGPSHRPDLREALVGWGNARLEEWARGNMLIQSVSPTPKARARRRKKA